MPDLDLDALEATARAATPGPWMLDGMGEDEPEINYWAHRFIGTAEPNESGSNEIIATSEDGHGPNAEYIAAFDPPTVLALIARIREAEDENRRLTLQAAESEHARRLAFEAKDRANAARAEAEATIDAVRANLSNAPECDEHPDDGPITCGWKSDMIRVRAAIARHQDKRENGSDNA